VVVEVGLAVGLATVVLDNPVGRNSTSKVAVETI